jgi:uncharacterized protein YndB with AHSA1/START domain
MRRYGGRIRFPRHRELVFDYLVDPRHRPEWQSSLRRVSSVSGEVGLGQTWVDETKPGLKARMRTTEFDRPVRWSESGTWRFVRAELTLDLEDADGGAASYVDYRFRIVALGPLGALASRLSVRAVGSDLRRAASRLAAPPT